MFTKTRPEETMSPVPTARGRDAAGGRGTTFSIIGDDVVITGNLSASVDLHVDGRIEGDVTCAQLVQGASSTIAGAVTAETARLAGTLEGSIEASELVIEASARIKGDVTYESLRIEQGGTVDGSFRHRSARALQRTHAEPMQPARENPTLSLAHDAA